MTLTDFDRTCFVIMPMGPDGSEFRELSDEVYNRIIKAAVRESGLDLRCVRSDEINRSGSIIDDIIRYCVKSKFVVADMTRRNPNVFYELGIRHSWANRTILMANNISDLPFDVNPLRTIIYSTATTNKANLAKDKLVVFLREMVDDSDVAETDSPVLKLFSSPSRNREAKSGASEPQADTRSRRALSGLEDRQYWSLRDTLYLMGYEAYDYDDPESSEFRLYGKPNSPHVDQLVLFELPALHAAEASASAFAVFKKGTERLWRLYWPDTVAPEDKVKLVVYTHWKPKDPEEIIRRLRAIATLTIPQSEAVTSEDLEEVDVHGTLDAMRDVPIELWDMKVVEEMWESVQAELFSKN